ncbi:MAG: hypothetical protein C4576_17800 [Desulfobacteraceae bacterium]|nr:MAG: hypothetical protein C4576_17800 [Desulfobacteraceae bacterium]
MPIDRIGRIIFETIERLELDLRGLVIVTEAASGPFVVTPIIAATAGAARVVALTRTSSWATSAAVVAGTRALAKSLAVGGRIEITTRRRPSLFQQADIVTNLGFVRPIDASMISLLPRGAVVALMCESWEFRPGDVDLVACRQAGISVCGVNEEHPSVDVFGYSATLAAKLLLEAGIEVRGSRVAILGGDKFAPVIARGLRQMGACASIARAFEEFEDTALVRCDALMVADYLAEGIVLGDGTGRPTSGLMRLDPSATIVQFAGRIDFAALKRTGHRVFPGKVLGSHRMLHTLAYLGPRPVVELHTAGLKSAEINLRCNRTSHRPGADWVGLVQPI